MHLVWHTLPNGPLAPTYIMLYLVGRDTPVYYYTLLSALQHRLLCATRASPLLLTYSPPSLLTPCMATTPRAASVSAPSLVSRRPPTFGHAVHALPLYAAGLTQRHYPG